MKTKQEVEILLDRVEKRIKPMCAEADAYNYLVDFTEGLIYASQEGDRLVRLCYDMLSEAHPGECDYCGEKCIQRQHGKEPPCNE